MMTTESHCSLLWLRAAATAQGLIGRRPGLQRAESALLSLRRDILPQNERLYQVMAESYVDTIMELRGQVDSYLEINAMPENADLVISLEGDRVGLGRARE